MSEVCQNCKYIKEFQKQGYLRSLTVGFQSMLSLMIRITLRKLSKVIKKTCLSIHKGTGNP